MIGRMASMAATAVIGSWMIPAALFGEGESFFENEGPSFSEIGEHRASGEFWVDGHWVDQAVADPYYGEIHHPYQAVGKNVVVITNHGIDFGDRMLDVAEKAYQRTYQFFGKQPEESLRPLRVIVASRLEDYQLLGGVMGDQKSSNFYAFCSSWKDGAGKRPVLFGVTLFQTNDDLSAVYVAHAVAEQFVHRLTGPDGKEPAPRWFADGVASYIERWQTESMYQWSLARLGQLGGSMELKRVIRGDASSEQAILQSGLLIAYLKSAECDEKAKRQFNDALLAFNDGKKVSKAFRKLEKLLEKGDDSYRSFSGL